jgi:hypothetical protein
MTVIDVHTHMLTLDWIELLKRYGGVYDVKPTRAGQNSIWKDGAPFMTLMPGMWDYDLRIKAMDSRKGRRRDRLAHLPELLLRRSRGEPERPRRSSTTRWPNRRGAAGPHPLAAPRSRGNIPTTRRPSWRAA